MKKLLLTLLLCSCTSTGQYTLTEENDYFGALGPNTDHNYTQGIKLTRREDNESYGIGQNIYTPSNKHTPDPVPGDRPYAGYLYGEASHFEQPKDNVERRYSVQAGVIGPASGGKQSQCTVHGLLGQACPLGWGNQLSNEPTLNLFIEEKRKFELYHYGEFIIDLVPNYGIDLGNVSTLVRLGSIVRIGVLAPDFGPSPIAPRAQHSGKCDGENTTGAIGNSAGDNCGTKGDYQEPERPAIYGFFGTEGRAIARNIFLDGNTFDDSESVNKNPFVADLKFGFGIHTHGYRIIYTYIHITDEWESQNARQDFGSLSIGWGF